MSDQTTLDPNLSVFDPRRLFSLRGVWTFAFVGLAIVVTAMASMWGPSGYLVDEWSLSRFLVVLIAAAYGLILGWMIFPRIGPARDL